ncbi:MAG: hypothetical protein WA372_08185 [Candidatus Sulfotelmatobacter sp.]
MSNAKKKRKSHPRIPCPCGRSEISLMVHRKPMCPKCIREAGLAVCGEHGDWFGVTGDCITCVRARRRGRIEPQVQTLTPEDLLLLKSFNVEPW